MAVNNLRIVYDNFVDYTNSVITVSSTASTALLGSNLKVDTRGLIWRSASHTTFNTPVIFKSATSAATAGVHSNLNLTLTPSSGGGTFYVTVTGNGDPEDSNTTVLPFSTNILNTAGKTSYVVRFYSNTTVAGSSLLAMQTVPVVMSVAGTVNAVITNQYVRIPSDSTGTTMVYTGAGANLMCFDGTTPMRYLNSATAPGSFTVATATSNITAGTIAAAGNNSYATISVPSAMTTGNTTATITYTFSGRRFDNSTFSNVNVVQTFVKSLGTISSTISYAPNLDTTCSRAVIQVTGLTAGTNVGCAALTLTNLGVGATMRLLGYNATTTTSGSNLDLPYWYTGATRSFDTGPQLCSPFTSTVIPSLTGSTYGTTTYGLDKNTARVYVPTGIQAAATTVLLEIVDPQNTNNYIEGSRLVLGPYWKPKINTEYGLGVTINDTSETNRSEGGDLVTSMGVVYRSMNFNLNYLDTTDRSEIVKILRTRGKRRPIFVSLFPENSDDYEQENLHQMYCKLSDSVNLSHPYYQYYAASISLEEM